MRLLTFKTQKDHGSVALVGDRFADLRIGDIVETEIEKMGTIRNRVIVES